MCFIVTKSRLKYNKTPDDLAKALQGEVPADQTLKHNTVNFLHQECTRLHSSGGTFIKLTLYIIFRGYCCIEHTQVLGLYDFTSWPLIASN